MKEKEINEKKFLEEVLTKTNSILRTRYPELLSKQTLELNSSTILVACPYCGDSITDDSKKRGHIMLRGKWAGHYKCFNCGKFVEIEKFFSDNNEKLSEESIKYIQEHKQEMCEEK